MKHLKYLSRNIALEVILILIIIVNSLQSCTPISYDSQRFNNIYIVFSLVNMDSIYVSRSNQDNELYNSDSNINFEKLPIEKNGANFLVKVKELTESYEISIRHNSRVDYLFFSGSEALNQNWITTSNYSVLRLGKLKPSENGFYYIGLSSKN